MLATATRNAVAKALGCKIQHIEPLRGGSTSQTFKLITEKFDAVLKYMPTATDDFFAAEVAGLEALAKSEAFKTPTIIAFEKNWLLQSYVTQNTTPNWRCFGEQLALLHFHSAAQFGFKENNYFATLPQTNTWQNDWCSFYAEQRLRPLFHHPALSTLQQQKLNHIADNLSQWLNQSEKPSLIHGDLWSANIIFNDTGICLIDPATYYASREIELAYLEFVGDAHTQLLESYHYHFPIDKDFYQRKDFYLLYPYLCHLHLYGESYLPGGLALLSTMT